MAVIATVLLCAGFFALLGLMLPTLREPRQSLAFCGALVAIVTVFIVRGVGRRQDAVVS
ncbi:hypothetical protein [Microbacterium sp.]|uniref:hypothetical protein n=1 Tax=Microbacterium sp. TaxID=51671 RepID=UPI0039E56368